ncbi:hypothetical protein SNEBB_005136 [Seison nebaliae]|nr:hypothetical protein SNEBB_005136 [Seison nebaliae]
MGEDDKVYGRLTEPSNVDTDGLQTDARVTARLFYMIIAITFGGSFVFGYYIGVVNAPTAFVQEFYREVYSSRHGTELTEGRMEALWSVGTVAIFLLGALIASSVSGFLADKVGRKKALYIHYIPVLIGSMLMALAVVSKSPEMVMIGRFFVGVHAGLTIGISPMYLSEIAPKNLRGSIGVGFQMMLVIGIFVAQLLGFKEITGNKQYWPLCFALGGLPAIVSAVMMLYVPESPTYLLRKKMKTQAINVLHRLREGAYKGSAEDQKMLIEKEVNEMMAEDARNANIQTIGVAQLFKDPNYRIKMMTGMLLHISQQWSGVNAIFFYSESIFKNAKIPGAYIAYIVALTGFINVLATVVSLWLMDKSGRRRLILVTFVLIIIDFLLITMAQFLKTKFPVPMRVLLVICIFLFIVLFAIGIGPIPFLYVAEIFPQNAKGIAITICSMCNNLSNLILTMSFKSIERYLTIYSFVPFTVILLVSTIFFYFRLPETKGKTLSEINVAFKVADSDDVADDNRIPLTKVDPTNPMTDEPNVV